MPKEVLVPFIHVFAISYHIWLQVEFKCSLFWQIVGVEPEKAGNYEQKHYQNQWQLEFDGVAKAWTKRQVWVALVEKDHDGNYDPYQCHRHEYNDHGENLDYLRSSVSPILIR